MAEKARIVESSHEGTHLANSYMQERRHWWNKWTKGGLVTAGLAGLAYLALLPWSIPATALAIIYPALASTAIVGGGMSAMGALFGGTLGMYKKMKLTEGSAG